MQVPIPDDWDGTSFCCHIVEWPDSPAWRQILAGLLLSPSSGRFWDGATGTIIDAQETGREIETRNCIFDEDS
jgi:hypothetical protein